MRESHHCSTHLPEAVRWPLPMHSPRPIRTSGWRRCSIDVSMRWPKCPSRSRSFMQRAVQRHRRSRRGRKPGRGAGQQVSRRYSRGRRDRVRPAGVPDDDVPGPTDPLEHLGSSRSNLRSADLDMPRRQLDKSRGCRATDRSKPEVRCSEGRRPAQRGHPALQERPSRGTPSELKTVLLPHQQARAGRREHRRGSARRRRGDRGAGARSSGRCRGRAAACSSKPRRRSSTTTNGPRCSRPRSREGAVPRFIRGRLRTDGLRTFSHDRREGEPGVDLPGRLDAPQCAGVIHTDFERGFIRPRRSVGRAARRRFVARRPRQGHGPLRGQGLHRPGRRCHGVPLQRLSSRCQRAGTPITVIAGGTCSQTTAPAPMTAS